MSQDRAAAAAPATPEGGNWIADLPPDLYPVNPDYRLRLNPNADYQPESYDDLETDFAPLLFSTLERYLPQNILQSSRDEKVNYMRDVLSRYSTEKERHRGQRHREYRQKIMSNYQPLNSDIYTMEAEHFFVPSFLKAVNDNTVESFRNIMAEPSPGVFTFEMLQPRFCDMLLAEVENFEKWVHETKFRIMRPNIMNRYGAVLDDFGLENMLEKFMEGYISPMSRVFYPEVGGTSLDSHHGFVVEYGLERDLELGFHVDDSEVTLNVCLGKQFTGGELYFRGTRCERHVNSETQPEEVYDYEHAPGRAVLHRGRHRHGARSTTSGHRINMLLWCRSSAFRELRKYQTDFSAWCGECEREKKVRQHQSLEATQLGTGPTGNIVLLEPPQYPR